MDDQKKEIEKPKQITEIYLRAVAEKQRIIEKQHYIIKRVVETAEEVDWQIINEYLDKLGLIRIKASLKLLLQVLAEIPKDSK